MTLLVVYLLIAVGVSFLCSVLEAVLLSVTPGFVESQLGIKPTRGRVLKDVKENLDKSLSSILIPRIQIPSASQVRLLTQPYDRSLSGLEF